MTKKSQARLDRDRTKAERTRMANLLGTHPDSRLIQNLTAKLPASPMFGSPLHSPAIASARAAYLKTDPMLMVKELAESFQGLVPGTPEHDAAAARAESALRDMSKDDAFEPFADLTKLPDDAIVSAGRFVDKFHDYQQPAVLEKLNESTPETKPLHDGNV